VYEPPIVSAQLFLGVFSLHPQVFFSTSNNYHFTPNKFLYGRWMKVGENNKWYLLRQWCIFALVFISAMHSQLFSQRFFSPLFVLSVFSPQC